jgi:hypothetical protein
MDTAKDDVLSVRNNFSIFRKRAWGRLYVWICLQVFVGSSCLVALHVFHANFFGVECIQWPMILLILYWQMRSYAMEGFKLVFTDCWFLPWDVIRTYGSQRALIYKIEEEAGMTAVCYCVLFYKFRWKVLNWMEVQVIRFWLWAKLLK